MDGQCLLVATTFAIRTAVAPTLVHNEIVQKVHLKSKTLLQNSVVVWFSIQTFDHKFGWNHQFGTSFFPFLKKFTKKQTYLFHWLQ
jgi:hypothetical protein